jgi:hypothetical protein
MVPPQSPRLRGARRPKGRSLANRVNGIRLILCPLTRGAGKAYIGGARVVSKWACDLLEVQVLGSHGHGAPLRDYPTYCQSGWGPKELRTHHLELSHRTMYPDYSVASDCGAYRLPSTAEHGKDTGNHSDLRPLTRPRGPQYRSSGTED